MPVSTSTKRRLAPLAKAVAPQWFWRRKYGILARLGAARSDVRMARMLCDPGRVSLDIGADVGEFTIAMSTTSRSVIAFEPRPAQARELEAMFTAVGASVRVEAMALSDHTGVAPMRVLEAAPGRSTIDDDNALDGAQGDRVDVIDVPVRRLDDLKLRNVGFVKVDVEGHELAVLHGADAMLRRNRPALLIEAEERHHPGAVVAVADFLAHLGYAGYFPADGGLRPIDHFEPDRHQNLANVTASRDRPGAPDAYVNDFVFLPIKANG